MIMDPNIKLLMMSVLIDDHNDDSDMSDESG